MLRSFRRNGVRIARRSLLGLSAAAPSSRRAAQRHWRRVPGADEMLQENDGQAEMHSIEEIVVYINKKTLQ
ncbi:hypothetical protein HKW98_15635 [Stutzerimonas urumqiensis]|uniref:hypothetical protein n=1 Tax=Stutzerimonas urumqiensis TaxID=638269 RepID=UPI003BA8E8BA